MLNTFCNEKQIHITFNAIVHRIFRFFVVDVRYVLQTVHARVFRRHLWVKIHMHAPKTENAIYMSK